MTRKVNQGAFNSPAGKRRLCQQFELMYPNPSTELIFKGEYELVVSVLLSAQCTDKKVNQVTPILFSTFPNFAALRGANVAAIEAIIRPINYYRTKARNLLALASDVMSKHHGRLPREHADLVELPGVGNKTANVVLNELGVRPTFPVDTHVFRLAHRLGLSKGKDVEAVEADLCAAFAPETWRNLHHWLILHGRRVCKAQRPQCSACTLSNDCPSSEVSAQSPTKIGEKRSRAPRSMKL